MTQRDNTTNEDRDLKALFDDLRREERTNVPPFDRHPEVSKSAPGYWRFAFAASVAGLLMVGLVSAGLFLWAPEDEYITATFIEGPELGQSNAPQVLVPKSVEQRPLADMPAAEVTESRSVPYTETETVIGAAETIETDSYRTKFTDEFIAGLPDEHQGYQVLAEGQSAEDPMAELKEGDDVPGSSVESLLAETLSRRRIERDTRQEEWQRQAEWEKADMAELASVGYLAKQKSRDPRIMQTVITLAPGEEGLDYPELGAESYAATEDNPFHIVTDEPLSTFSADVDTASYSNVRRFLANGEMPPRDAVRIEELINYFDYDHPAARGDDPFGVAVEVAECPWNPRHRLARITLAARNEVPEHRGSNLVFLLDVSGSMRPSNKLPLVRRALGLLVDQLGGRDTISIVVYAGASGLVLPPTPGSDRATILDALDRLEAGGSTAGAAGLKLAYKIARDNFIEGGVNRVILATDGDFNVGVTSQSELLDILEADAKRGIFLTTLGFGMGNLKDDRLEQLADKGNGNYAYIDTLAEGRKVLVEEIDGTLVTVAKDVKFQVEFNPREVGAYRLIGYENRLLAHRDFNDDTKDAGEVGAGHTVTVLYELVPPDEIGAISEVDPLRYADESKPSDAAASGELFTVKIRFKRPDEDVSSLRTYPVRDEGLSLRGASDDMRFAAAVASFGMRLRESEPARDFGWGEIKDLAAGALGRDDHGHRAAFTDLLDKASRLDSP